MRISADIAHRVGGIAVDTYFKVEMDTVKTVAVAGVADAADGLTLPHTAAHTHIHGTQVGVQRRHAVTVVNDDAVAVCAGILRHDNRTAVCRDNRGAHALVAVNIDAGVEGARAGTVAIGTGDHRMAGERPYIGTASAATRRGNKLLLHRDFFIDHIFFILPRLFVILDDRGCNNLGLLLGGRLCSCLLGIIVCQEV